MIPLAESFENLLDFLTGAGLHRAIRLFWHFFFLDFPRYILTDAVLLITALLWGKERRRERVLPSPGTPLVTVIMPVLNEQYTLFRSIQSLHDQTYRPIEIVLIDDGSSDATPAVCRDLARRFQNRRPFRMPERSGKAAGLKLGVHYARGDIICFVDGDTTFDRDAIAELVAPFSDPGVGCVSGNVRVRNPRDNLLTEIQNLEYGLTIAVGRRIRSRLGILSIVSGAFGAFRREIVEAAGGHDPGPGNDSDLTIKFRKLGYRIAFAPKAVCMTDVPTTVGALVRQRRRWSRNLIRNRVFKHGNLFHPHYRTFDWLNALANADGLFFHVFLAFTSLLYLFDLALNFPTMLPFLLFVNYLLYSTADLFETLVMMYFSERRSMDSLSLLYWPLFNLYKRSMKLVRVYAYVEELLFKRSHADPFAPARIRGEIPRW
ncbi:MAG: glycosyltransferase family 2 protein [Deltaproteobacteria bacterium]|nr:glycosyltransferase family 2 protein [Deltaproteobacteria bacterium]